MYISEVKGSLDGLSYPLDRKIDFDFDFNSFVRAGEAKLCGCVRDASSTLGLGSSKTPRRSGPSFEQ